MSNIIKKQKTHTKTCINPDRQTRDLLVFRLRFKIFLWAAFFGGWWCGSKNTGVGCHSLLQEIFPTQGLDPRLPHCRQMLYRLSHKGRLSSVSLAAQLCLTLCDPMVCPWGSPGKNSGVGSYSLLQGIFPTQGSNPGLLHCIQILMPFNSGLGLREDSFSVGLPRWRYW